MIARRTLLKGASFAAMAATILGASVSSAGAQQVPYSSGTEAPKLKVPANACDCHMHIYDARFPAVANATLKPPDALVDDYKKLQKRIGTSRNVIVTPSTYGTDNSATLDGMAKIGPTVRGVAVVDASVTDAELKRLNGLGIREGAFVLFLGPLGVSAGQAVAVGLIVYALTLAVSLLGAPAFAVGGRSRAVSI